MVVSFGLVGVAFPSQSFAGNLGADPNLPQRVDQFIYHPAPEDLLLPPKPAEDKPDKKPPKGTKG